MDSNLKSPLTAAVVIFVCSCVAAVLTFQLLKSTATFEDNQGLQLGGAIVGLLATFVVLWQSFHTFSKELGEADRDKLTEKIKNLENQVLRQNPPPTGYRRLLSAEFQLVAHIPTDWIQSDTMLAIFAPSSKNTNSFMDNIVIYRYLAKIRYRTLILTKKQIDLPNSYDPNQDLELQKRIATLRASVQQEPLTDNQLETETTKLVDSARNTYVQAKISELNKHFLLHRDDPIQENEKVTSILELTIEVLSSKMLGVPERTQIDKHPAIRYQTPNPLQEESLVNLVTDVFVEEGDGYLYQITLTSPRNSASAYTDVYNRILNSFTFLT
jgi:hypothetical protein